MIESMYGGWQQYKHGSCRYHGCLLKSPELQDLVIAEVEFLAKGVRVVCKFGYGICIGGRGYALRGEGPSDMEVLL